MRHALDHQEFLIQRLHALEDPLGLICWTYVVFVTSQDRHRHLPDVLNWNVCLDAVLLITRVQVTVLLEPALHAILKHVHEGFVREVLRSPIDVLLAPCHSQVRANHAPDFVPVFTRENMQAQHVAHRHDLLEERHASL